MMKEIETVASTTGAKKNRTAILSVKISGVNVARGQIDLALVE